MLNQLKKYPAILIAVLALVAVSCNTNDDPVDPNGTKPNKPTNLKAQSRSATSVGLQWDAPAAGVTPTGYRVYYNITGNATKTAVDVSGASTTSAVVDGLTDGTKYEFTVQALNGTVVGDATSILEWSPANRTASIRLYSSQSAQGSGLIVFSGNPRNATTSIGDLWDLCYDDTDPAHPTIGSPGVSGYVDDNYMFISAPTKLASTTYIGRQYPNVNNLDEIWETEDLNDETLTTTLKENAYDLSSPGGTGGLAFVFARKNSPVSYTYGKVLVLRTGGTFVQGSDPNKYIDVIVSYQTTADVPYALKAKIDALETQGRVKHVTAE